MEKHIHLSNITNMKNVHITVSQSVESEDIDLKQRKALKNAEKFKALLAAKIPKGLILGTAHDQGDCFFDALAQSMNQINQTTVNTDKYLRSECHDFYKKNKGLVDSWNAREFGGIDSRKDDYYFVQYTVDECKEHFHGKTPIWGRPNVEGKILCHQLNLEAICNIEILEDPESKQPIVSFHLATKDSYKSISEEEAQVWLKNPKIPSIVVEQSSLHFVPLLSKNKRLEIVTQLDRKFLDIKDSNTVNLNEKINLRLLIIQKKINELVKFLNTSSLTINIDKNNALQTSLTKQLNKILNHIKNSQNKLESLKNNEPSIYLTDILVDIRILIEKLTKKIVNKHFENFDYKIKEYCLNQFLECNHYANWFYPLPGEATPNPMLLQQSEQLRKEQKDAENSSLFQQVLRQIKALGKRQNALVSCFISYAWPSEDRYWENWIQEFLKKFRSHLESAGITVFMDLIDSREGYNSNEHMDRIITASRKVILIGTESLMDKFRIGVSSICYELNLIQQRRASEVRLGRYNVIPLIINGTIETALPAQFERFTVIRHCGGDYLSSLKAVIAQLYDYGYDHTEYNACWNKILDKLTNELPFSKIATYEVNNEGRPLSLTCAKPDENRYSFLSYRDKKINTRQNLTTKDACRAASKGDIQTLKKCIDAGVNFNATAEFFQISKAMTILGPCTPLMAAVINGYFDIVETIIENVPNLDINYRGGRLKDYTALDCAAKWSEDEWLLNYLHDHGATSANPLVIAEVFGMAMKEIRLMFKK